MKISIDDFFFLFYRVFPLLVPK